MVQKKHFALMLFLSLILLSVPALPSLGAVVMAGGEDASVSGSGSSGAGQPSGSEHASSGSALTIVKDGFWHITYDEDDIASCKFYMMPIRSPRGSTFSYAKDRWVCEPYETRTLWYFVGDDEYLVEGWQKIDGVWYYFEERTGRMYADELTPDGHYMGPDGALSQ